MKKWTVTLTIAFLLSIATSAMSTQWVDSVSNNSKLNNGDGKEYSFIYNITGAGSPANVLSNPSNVFHPGIDVISSADLFLNFTVNGNSVKTADIALDGVNVLTSYTIADKDLNLDLTAVAQLNTDGTVTLSIYEKKGTYTLTDSILTATGTDNTPVPESSTAMLLGAGLLGIGVFRWRLKR